MDPAGTTPKRRPVFTVDEHRRAESEPALRELMKDYLHFAWAANQQAFSADLRKEARIARMMTAGSLAHRYGIRVE